MSANAKKWLIGIGIVGGLCVIACVVIALLGGQLGSAFVKSVKTDPTDVAQLGSKIADYTVPTGYVQAGGMSIFMYDFVTYTPPEGQQGMMIMLMQFKSGTVSQEQMQQALEQQSGQSTSNMHVVKTYQTAIRGQSSTVTIREGVSSGTPAIAVRQLMTFFPGKGGTVTLMITDTTDSWDQSVVDDFIASIR